MRKNRGKTCFFLFVFLKAPFIVQRPHAGPEKSRVGTGAICLVKIFCPIFHKKNLPSRVGVVARKLGDFVLFAFHKPLV